MRSILYAALAGVAVCLVQADYRDQVDGEKNKFVIRNVNGYSSANESGHISGSASASGSISCPTPVERCCIRIMNNPSATLRVDTRTAAATLTSITVWNDAPNGAPLLPVGGGPANPPEVAILASGATLWCSIGSAEMATAKSGYAGWPLLCPASGGVMTLSFPGLLAPSSPPGRLAIRMCTVAPSGAGGAPPPAVIWIQQGGAASGSGSNSTGLISTGLSCCQGGYASPFAPGDAACPPPPTGALAPAGASNKMAPCPAGEACQRFTCGVAGVLFYGGQCAPTESPWFEGTNAYMTGLGLTCEALPPGP
jgi:hypothetical protein